MDWQPGWRVLRRVEPWTCAHCDGALETLHEQIKGLCETCQADPQSWRRDAEAQRAREPHGKMMGTITDSVMASIELPDDETRQQRGKPAKGGA